jgi:adenosylhomocysteine nucleosidase
MSAKVLVVCGLTKEARIAAGPGILAVAGGGSRAGLEAQLDRTDIAAIGAVVSFGIAGALAPGLRVGDVLVATEVRAPDARWTASASLRRRWIDRLQDTDLPLVECPIAGVDVPLLTPVAKRAVFAESGADGVDMESHVAAAFADRHRLPFGVIRVVSDRADHVLPPAAGAAMRPDGSVDVLGVMRSLARDPRQIPALVATARDAAVAFRTLGRVRGLLSLRGGLLGLDL